MTGDAGQNLQAILQPILQDKLKQLKKSLTTMLQGHVFYDQMHFCVRQQESV